VINKGKMVAQLSDDKWVMAFPFIVAISTYHNELNNKHVRRCLEENKSNPKVAKSICNGTDQVPLQKQM
jgi:hypothetical protein